MNLVQGIAVVLLSGIHLVATALAANHGASIIKLEPLE